MKSLRPAYETYLRTTRGYSVHTQRAYLRDLDDLNDFLGKETEGPLFNPDRIDTLTHRHIRHWMGNLMGRNLSTRSVARKLSAVRTYLAYLHRKGIIAENPAGRMHLPKPERRLPSFMKENEVELLLDQLEFSDTFEGVRDKCLLELLYGCGLRRSELIGLKRGDISFQPPSLRVHGKGNKDRIVPFGPHLVGVLERYMDRADRESVSLSQAFLVRPNGKPLYPKLVYRIVNQHLSAVSSLKQRSPHVLRHTYATHLLERGADLNAIKELLGHQSLAATQVYTHNSIQKLKDIHLLAHPRAETSKDTDI